MKDRFYMLMLATSGNERNETKFECYQDVKEAEAVVQDWLMRYCGMEVIPYGQEEAVRAANDGKLPEDAFLCPQVEKPQDLVKYNGFYDYESLGVFNVFLTPVCDKDDAQRFCSGMNKEYEIDQEFSERADRMMEQLHTFVRSFEDDSVDAGEAVDAIRTFLLQGGFPLFDFGEGGIPDTVVLPSDGSPWQGI